MGRCTSKLWFQLKSWRDSFDSGDDARLIQRNIDRECARKDIAEDVWADFLRDLLSRITPADPFDAVDSILRRDEDGRFLLPGKTVSWPVRGQVYNYVRLDRFNEQTLGFVIGGDVTLVNLENEIRTGRCNGASIEGKVLGQNGRPVWVTDATLADEPSSDVVRNRLGMRWVNQPGYCIVELKYRGAYLRNREVILHAPTILDAWRGGARRSWIFTKRCTKSETAEWGYTIDLSNGGACERGVPEALHAPFGILVGQGHQIKLRALDRTTSPPPEISLLRLLENASV